MNIRWLQSLTDYIGIDLGSSRVRIWGKNSGLLIDDEAAVAIDTKLQKVIAVGHEAAEMNGRVSQHIQVRFPITADGIADQDVAAAMLRAMLQRVFRLGLFFRPVMVVTIHSSLGEPERQEVVELFLSVGAREVYLVDEVLAAAIGTGVPVADASGSLFLHSGHSTTEVSMISLGSVVLFKSSKFAGAQVTQHFQQFMKQNYDLLLGVTRAESMKCQVLGQGQRLPARVRLTGQDMKTRTPKEIIIEGETLNPIVEYAVQQYLTLTQRVLEQVPPELTQDVLEKGMLLSGGSSQLVGVAGQLSQRLGFPVSVVDEPTQVVSRGIGQVLSNLQSFKDSVGYRPIR
jgi:rod shape-determining protein MreB and related proteins